MKRTIAGILFLIALGAGTMLADDGYGRGRDISLRRGAKSSMTGANFAAIFITGTARRAMERQELRREYRDVNRYCYKGTGPTVPFRQQQHGHW